MSSEGGEEDDVARTVNLTGRIGSWLRALGVEHTEMAVDIADILAAARHAESLVDDLLELRPHHEGGADESLAKVGELHAWLFTEMKPHLAELETTWSEIEDRLEALIPDEE